MHTGREVIDTGTLATQVKDLNLGVGDTTIEPALGVGLVCSFLISRSSFLFLQYFHVDREEEKRTLAVAVATSGTAGHCSCCFRKWSLVRCREVGSEGLFC